MNIGQIIYNRRKELGLTMEQIGEFVGVGKSTVKKWESGAIANLKRDKIAKLSEILQLNPVVFISADFKEPDDTVTYALFHGNEKITEEMQAEIDNYINYKRNSLLHEESRPSPNDTIDKNLISHLSQLTSEEQRRVDDFVQGILASR